MENRIDISSDRDLQVWSRTFHVSPEKLVDLVREFGPAAEQLRDALKRAEIARIGGRRQG